MQRIGFVVSTDFSVMSFAAIPVFETANTMVAEPRYAIHILSEAGGTVVSSFGMSIQTERFGDATFDTLIVTGAMEPETGSPQLHAFVRNNLASARRLSSICTGAFILAEAGVLEGRHATTHWGYARQLQMQFPGIQVEADRIFTVDGNVWTSAGMTAGIDLALAMVEADMGEEVARAVARKLVMYHRRAGGQSQFSALLDLAPKSDRIQQSLDYARQNLRLALSVDDLADAAHLSPRQFSRAFRAETGQSPAKAVENIRLEAARLMMEQSRHPIDVVARETGFADRERMRRAFIRAFGQPPQAIRRNARIEAA